MTTIHLICGPIGAGKTTYALNLCEELGAIHFSIDDWMVTLFSPDMPQPHDWTWIIERVARCEKQIMTTAVQIGQKGLQSVLDLGFLQADHRKRIADLATAHGLAVKLHFIDTEIEERWRRVSSRNAEKGTTFRLTISRPMFNFVETLWQAPTAEEMAMLNGISVQPTQV